MPTEKYWSLNWTWKYTGGEYCWSEYKVFETEEETREFMKQQFNNPSIKIVWCELASHEVYKGEEYAKD